MCELNVQNPSIFTMIFNLVSAKNNYTIAHIHMYFPPSFSLIKLDFCSLGEKIHFETIIRNVFVILTY